MERVQSQQGSATQRSTGRRKAKGERKRNPSGKGMGRERKEGSRPATELLVDSEEPQDAIVVH